MKKNKQIFILLFASIFLLVAQASLAKEVLRISTTTSTHNSGLLKVLHQVFEEKNDIKLNVIAVGTGRSLRIGSDGDVDLVFVHAPDAELKYVEQGYFIDRLAVMHNDFVIVGPASDPAGITPSKTVDGAFRKIAQSQSSFISRGDDSGTHKKEKQFWKQAGIEPEGAWYVSAGQGMGAVLTIANEKQAYTLSDRGTQLAFSGKISLQIIFEGNPALFNPYHVMAINPEKHPHVRYDLAKKYIDFVVSEQGQKIIAEFKKDGQQLFYPDANIIE